MSEQEAQEHRPYGKDPLRVSIHGLFALGVLYTMYLAHEVILPVVLAVMVSLLLSPLVRRAARYGVPRALAALFLLAAVVAGVAGIGKIVGEPALQWLEDAPEGIARLTVPDSDMREAFERMARSAEQVERAVAEAQETEDSSREAEPTVVVQQEEVSWRGQLAVGLRDTVVAVTLALTLTFFLLVSGDRLIQNYVRLLGARSDRRASLRMIQDAQREIARYLGFITISNGLVGVATAMLVWVIGLPEPVVWGVIAALLRFIPYLGVVLTVALLALVSAITFDEPAMMLAAPLGYLALSSLVGFIIEPYFHGYRLSVNPVVIFLSIFFWGWLWGAIGVLLAVPLMTVLQVILRNTPRLYPVYQLISR
ncbi:putative PurR-regulated permease PerM [Natronocella acetinitrilica]|uniref:PurR-regulated permease PerM n=1 Tax=Natronocella acetinitrilica TaxID=414046 RepID=A0AAE3G6H0_9GAMM|nr:putative PurR-regulated permease PerM [Natronocella acetinitrilica]